VQLPARACPRCHRLACDCLKGAPRARRHERAAGVGSYNSTAHRRWRAAVLARDPLCKVCIEESGEANADLSTQADHVMPIARGGAVFDLDNGQGLCARHHSIKTRRENAGGA
jgi:5-methylcytosine-specific restriction endonuclease McrA